MNLFDEQAVANAEQEIEQAIAEVLRLRGNGAVVGVAPAGAGKSHAIGTAVKAAREAGMRVAVTTPTNDQAYALLRDLAKRLTREGITFVPGKGKELPAPIAGVQEKEAKNVGGDPIVIGTLNKLGDANGRRSLDRFDLLLVDEAYQANSVHYYGVGDLAPRHLLMGDPGQLAPFSTAPNGDRWRGLAEDPLQTAVDVLRRNHQIVPRKLPITRRLDPRAVPVARAFYPDHEFRAAVKAGVRRLELGPRGSRAGKREDEILETAAKSGWAHLELPSSAVLSADPETADWIARLGHRLLERAPRAWCENFPAGRPLEPKDVAVAVSHNDQKDLLRARFAAEGMSGVRVDTANKLQGLTFEVVVAWHPLAGLQEVDPFHLDPGRLCVMLTRHRQACIVIGREADRDLVEGIPPATPSYVGWDTNPALDGWYAHEAVFAALRPFRFAVP
jgi:hypothetical protein